MKTLRSIGGGMVCGIAMVSIVAALVEGKMVWSHPAIHAIFAGTAIIFYFVGTWGEHRQ